MNDAAYLLLALFNQSPFISGNDGIIVPLNECNIKNVLFRSASRERATGRARASCL